MKKIISSAIGLLCCTSFAFAQTTKIIADGKTLTSINQTIADNGRIILPAIPETLMLVFPADFYNYKARFSDGVDTTKDLVLTFDASAKPGKNLQIIPTQSATVELTFLNNKLWAIGSTKLEPAVTVPFSPKKQITVTIVSTRKAPVTKPTEPIVKSICDLLSDEEKKIQEELAIDPGALTQPFVTCYVNADPASQRKKIPFRYGVRLKADKPYDGFATSASYLLVYDLRNKPDFSPFTILKIKKDKARNWEYFEPLKGDFRPAAGKSLVIQVIGEKDSTYVFKSDSTTRFMDAEQDFVKQMTPQTNTTPVATANTAKKDSVLSKALEAVHATKPAYQVLKENIVSAENGLADFNRVFNDINFREQDYFAGLTCVQNKMRVLFGEAPSDGDQLAALILAIVVKDQTPNKYYQDFCNHASSLKALYDMALSKKITYSSTLTEMTVPDVDAFNIHIRTKNTKTDLSNKSFNIQSGFKIDFSTGVIYSSLGTRSFVVGSQNFQYKDAVQTVDPKTGAITTTYNPNLLSATRKVIYSNQGRAFGAGILAHAYIRTGGFFNFGVASGVFLNASQIQAVLGPSVLLGNETRRWCISGGLVAGQVSELSAENQQSYFDGKSKIYDNVNDLPQDYSSTSSPATVNRMKYNGWFISLTYNLASAKK